MHCLVDDALGFLAGLCSARSLGLTFVPFDAIHFLFELTGASLLQPARGYSYHCFCKVSGLRSYGRDRSSLTAMCRAKCLIGRLTSFMEFRELLSV
jgi:hypothetical protein